MSEEVYTKPPLVIAIKQLTVLPDPVKNIATIRDTAGEAKDRGARVLLLPEGIIARDPAVPDYAARHAQTIDGEFVSELRTISAESGLAIMGTVHLKEPDLPAGKVSNVFLVIDSGDIKLAYRKLHLYDAFNARESDDIQAGSQVPDLVDIDGWKFGVMTCYDLRFPELSRALALAGADVLAVSAAWVRGGLKENHWAVMCEARALENTSYLLACSELSSRNIGNSRVVDPMGQIISNAGDRRETIYATLDAGYLALSRKSLPVLDNMRFAPPRLI